MPEPGTAPTRRAIFLLALFLIVAAACAPATSSEPAGSATAETGTEATSDFVAPPGSTVFTILPAESEARFLIDEILYGEQRTVTGRTSQIEGSIAVNLDDPRASAAGPIRVAARTLVTDSALRDRAIHNRVLLSGIYEHIIFTPQSIAGLPERINTGEPLTLQVAGDLTITAHTKPAVFGVTLSLVSASRLEGQATTTIFRPDFDLVVPGATGLAAVADEIVLEFDFVAEAGE